MVVAAQTAWVRWLDVKREGVGSLRVVPDAIRHAWEQLSSRLVESNRGPLRASFLDGLTRVRFYVEKTNLLKGIPGMPREFKTPMKIAALADPGQDVNPWKDVHDKQAMEDAVMKQTIQWALNTSDTESLFRAC